MTPAKLTPLQLGSVIRNMWRAAPNHSVLGQFAAACLGREHPALSAAQAGMVLAAAASTDLSPAEFGRYVLVEYGEDLAGTFQSREDAPQPQKRTLTEDRVVELLEQRLGQLDARQAKVPRKATVKLTVNAHGLHTSVSLTEDSVHRFIKAFGQKRLRALVKVATAEKLRPGENRSFKVQKAVEDLLQQHQSVTYPHGIKVIQGGS